MLSHALFQSSLKIKCARLKIIFIRASFDKIQMLHTLCRSYVGMKRIRANNQNKHTTEFLISNKTDTNLAPLIEKRVAAIWPLFENTRPF